LALATKRPTRSDVAKLAGVSVATVSYVVNNGPRPVAPETRQLVLKSIETLGYKPHAIARSLRTGTTHTIGVLVPNVIAGYFGYLVTNIELQLQEKGYIMLLANSGENRDRERQMLALLSDHSIDGLLYVPISQKNNSCVGELINEGIPVVFMDRYSPNVEADIVMTDNVKAAKQATEYLIKSGCKRIVCISFHNEASSALNRVDGYRQALQENGLQVDEDMILLTRWPFGESAETMFAAHIETHGVPDGIFCTVEGFISESIRVLRKLGVYSNNQTLVAGGFTASEYPWHDLMDRPIPIVRQNTQLIAKRAVEMLMERIKGDKSPAKIELIPADFIT
jgi:LacI family transcriptional regulator